MSSLFLLPRNRDRIFRAIVNTEPANLIGFWPLDETSGTVARDYSGNARNGAHTAVSLGKPGAGDGRTSTLYDGSTSYTNVYSAALATAFNGAEGTLLIYAKVASAAIWNDGATVYQGAFLAADVSNSVILRHYPANTLGWIYTAGGTTKSVTLGSLSTLAFISIAITWSKSGDKMIAYYNGVQTGATQTGLGIWAGTLAAGTVLLGAVSTTPGWCWNGNLQHCALWSKALTVAQLRPASVT